MAAKPTPKVDVHVSETLSQDPSRLFNEKTAARCDEEHGAESRKRGITDAIFGDDWWTWEIIGIIGSAVALIGLVVLLRCYDGRKQPIWGEGKMICVKEICRAAPTVSLNSVVSVISTVAKICVLIPVTKGLGQLKWVYFAEKDRVLADFETFESATRGLTGSAMLVWRLRLRHFAVLGALAMILSLAFDPFVQNLVHYNPQDDYDPTQIAYVTNVTTYNAIGPLDLNANTVDLRMARNVIDALYNLDASESWAAPYYLCTSSNCTWDALASIGAEALCADITDRLEKNCTYEPGRDADPSTPGCIVSLPNGFSLGGPSNLPGAVMNINSSVGQPLVYTNYSRPLALIQSIAAFDAYRVNSSSPLVASECVIVPAVRRYTSQVINSKAFVLSGYTESFYTEQTLSYHDNYTLDAENGLWTLGPIPDDGRTFAISDASHKALNRFLAGALNGTVLSVDRSSYAYMNDKARDALQSIHAGTGNRYCGPGYANSEQPYDAVACAVNRAARAVSKTMRDVNWDHRVVADSHFINVVRAAGLVQGSGVSSYNHVQVVWYWISLPVALWLLSVVILLGTAWKSRRAGVSVWRTSPLAMVFMGMEGRLDEKVKRSGKTEKGLSDTAGELQVRLRVHDDRPMFVHAA